MTENIQTATQSKNGYVGWIILIIIILGLTLPFHYLPDSLKMFPKDHFTFKNTIIMQKDIDDIIERYNETKNIFQRNSMDNDPFMRTLMEQGIIYNKDKNETNHETEQ